MNLALAVEEYVTRRRSDGSPFVSSELNLKGLCRWCGHIELSSLTPEGITEFLNYQRCNAVTRISKFSSIKCFVNYWSLRGQMPALDLDKPPKPRSVPDRSSIHEVRSRLCCMPRRKGKAVRSSWTKERYG